MVPTAARCGCPCHPEAEWPCVSCETAPLHTGRPVPPPARDPRRVKAVERTRRYREALRADVERLRLERAVCQGGD